jgi:hypothetical protein
MCSLGKGQAMRAADVYVDLDGNEVALAALDAQERRLVARLRRRARANPDWDAFDNDWTVAVPAFDQARGLARRAVPRTLVWRIAQDLSGRLGIAAGLIRPADYRDELEELIREKFPSRRAFCTATGISEDMRSQVLAGRKDLSLEALTEALARIGYRLRIVPAAAGPATAAQKQTG